jgi:hypothetical protein
MSFDVRRPQKPPGFTILGVGRKSKAKWSIESLRLLPRSEKLKLMEMLWEELSHPDHEFESPAWHAKELAATERRLAEGREQMLDWNTAKDALRTKCFRVLDCR